MREIKKERIRDSFFELFYNTRKRSKLLGCLFVILIAGLLITYAFIVKEQTLPAVRFEEEGMIEVFYAWFSRQESSENREMVYQIIQKDGQNFLYINGKKQGLCNYKESTPAISFNLSPEEASNEALAMEDNETGVGKGIYHLKKSQAEKYLKYLQMMRNYELVSYSATSTIWDSYLMGKNDAMRFMYIYKTASDGILICAQINDNVQRPSKLNSYNINLVKK